MFGIQKRFANMGKVSGDTNPIIDEAIEKQQEIKKNWAGRRPKTLAVSNSKTEKTIVLPSKPSTIFKDDSKKNGLAAYWFPLVCAAAVASVALWTFWPKSEPAPSVPEPTVKVVDTKPVIDDAPKADEQPKKQQAAAKTDAPAFDIVRVESSGVVLIAGRAAADKTVSISMNNKIVATVQANDSGEFVYNPKTKLKPGNYKVQIIAGDAKSDVVFLYIDEKPENSMSLLMTEKSSKIMQAPKNTDNGMLAVSKIDYVANGRLVVQGKAWPKLRVSVSLNDKLLGMVRTSDHKNFGIGAPVGELKPGERYTLSVRAHDAEGNDVANFTHRFEMPVMTGADETFYVVRRDDCLWVIARNFLGKGIRFSIIAAENKIKNPNLIYPNQKFKIPVKAK